MSRLLQGVLVATFSSMSVCCGSNGTSAAPVATRSLPGGDSGRVEAKSPSSVVVRGAPDHDGLIAGDTRSGLGEARSGASRSPQVVVEPQHSSMRVEAASNPTEPGPAKRASEAAKGQPKDATEVANACVVKWSEFDRRINVHAPSIKIKAPSLADMRGIEVQLSVEYDDEAQVGGIAFYQVGTDWLWRAPEVEVVCEGDVSLTFKRIQTEVLKASVAEAYGVVLDRVAFDKLASSGFAAEVPKVGIVRIPAFYFAGLLSAFDAARVEHGVK